MLARAAIAATVLTLIILLCALVRPKDYRPAGGLSNEQQSLLDKPSAETAMERLRNFTRRPHIAGSWENYQLALEIKEFFTANGFDTQLEEFRVLLTYPKSRRVRFIQGEDVYEANLHEAGLDSCPKTCDRSPADTSENPCMGCIPTFNGYNPGGNVTANVVYVNFGRPEDYAELDKLGVSVNGSIALARYGGCNRGIKVAQADKHGAVGVLIYSDPAYYGAAEGAQYPDGAYLPWDGVQRGSVHPIWLTPGDPRTPGWASVPGSYALDNQEALTADVRLPVQPISGAEARELFARMGGQDVPSSFVGGGEWAYKVGGTDDVKVNLDISVLAEVRPIYNVIGTVQGTYQPDHLVILGNHYDAWVYGAVDPGTGFVALQEAVSGLGSLLKAGWKPRRTLMIAAWDAEEYGLVGSTEWAERHRLTLTRDTVAYINSDVSAGMRDGNFSASGSGSLNQLAREIAKEIRLGGKSDHADVSVGSGNVQFRVDLPFVDKTAGKTGPTLFDSWVNHTRAESGNTTWDPRITALGSGSDYTVFYHHLGIPIVDSGFEGGNPIYHSAYDTADWFEKNGDFGQIAAVAKFLGMMAIRLTNDYVLPFNHSDWANIIDKWMDEENLESLVAAYNTNDVAWPLYQRSRNATARMRVAYEALMALPDVVAVRTDASQATVKRNALNAVTDFLSAIPANQRSAREHIIRVVNNALLLVERALLDPTGIPSRPWFKHQISAPGRTAGYGAARFPAVAEAIEEQSEAGVEAALASLARSLESAAMVMEDALYLTGAVPPQKP